jgi:hypothetical protein
LLKEENGDLLADSHNILNWLKNYFLSYWMYIWYVMLDRNTYSWAVSTWS